MVFPPEVALASSHRKCHVLELRPLSLLLVGGTRCRPANIRTAEAVIWALDDHGLYTGIRYMDQTAIEKSPPRRRGLDAGEESRSRQEAGVMQTTGWFSGHADGRGWDGRVTHLYAPCEW